MKFKFYLFLVFFLLLGWFVFHVYGLDFSRAEYDFGVTFSQKYAEELELDWRETYIAILDELKVDHLRLSAYWDEVEAERDHYDFTDLDWQIEQAANRNVDITLAVGRRLPRWPECHDPNWLPELQAGELEAELYTFIHTVVERYKGEPAITRWQVENEPLLKWFGLCPKTDKDVLKEEIQQVRTLDDRPILSTDSGELGAWVGTAGDVDVFGHTLYRIVWNPKTGFWDYFFIPPAHYYAKGWLVKQFRPNVHKVIISELQMEPWSLGKPMIELTIEEQQQSFDLRRFWEHIIYAKKTGAEEIYTWGAEYWYWLKKQGRAELWEAGKRLWLPE